MSAPQLTLPQNPTSTKSTSKFSWGIFLVIILQIAILVALFLPQKKRSSTNTDSEYLKKVALKLEEVDLRIPAVTTLQRYLLKTSLPKKENAAIHMRIAKLLHNAKKYEEAIEYYFLAKELEEDKEQQRKIVENISDSLESLKRFNAMNAILSEHVERGYEKEEKEIIAQIDSREISADDLEKIIDDSVDSKIQTMQIAFPQMVNQQPNIASQMRQQYAQGKKTALQEYLFTEVLWRKALADDLEKNPRHLRLLKQIQKKMLSQEVLQREIKRQIIILPEEIQAQYSNNPEQFITPSSAKVAIKIFTTEEEAKQAKLSKDSFTEERVDINKDTSDLFEHGDVKEITADIFTSQKIELYENIYKTKKGFVKIWVDEIVPTKKKELSEVEGTIKQQVYQRKYNQIMQQFMTELYKKYKVQVYMEDAPKPDSEILKPKEETAEVKSEKEAKSEEDFTEVKSEKNVTEVKLEEDVKLEENVTEVKSDLDENKKK